MTLARAPSTRAEGTLPRANLLAERQAQVEDRWSGLRCALVRLIGVLAIGVVLVPGLLLVHSRVADVASVTRGRADRIADENARLAEAEQQGEARYASAEFVGATRARQQRWTDVVAVIGQVIPREVWLSRLVVKESEGREVLVVEGYATGLDVLPGFVRVLGRAVGGQQTQIEEVSEVEIDGQDLVRFTCKAVLRTIDGAESKQESDD